jgi:hypothetical protein
MSTKMEENLALMFAREMRAAARTTAFLLKAEQEGSEDLLNSREAGRRSRFSRASRRDALDCCGLLEQEARRLNSAAGGIDTSDNVSAKGPGVGIFFRKIDHLAPRIRTFSLFFQQHNPGQMPS